MFTPSGGQLSAVAGRSAEDPQRRKAAAALGGMRDGRIRTAAYRSAQIVNGRGRGLVDRDGSRTVTYLLCKATVAK